MAETSTAQRTGLSRFVPRADLEALKARFARIKAVSEEMDSQLLNRGLAYGTAAGIGLYEANVSPLPDAWGVDGKLIAGAIGVLGGEILAHSGTKSARAWGERIASVSDGAMILAIGDACRRGSIFVK